MPWVRLDDQFHRNKKVLAMSDSAHRIYTDALSYCAAVPDPTGFLSFAEAKTFIRSRAKRFTVADELVRLNAWERVDGGFMIHDFAEFLPERSRDRMRALREKKRASHQRHGDVTVTDGDSHAPSPPSVTVTAGDVTSRATGLPEPEPVGSTTRTTGAQDPPLEAKPTHVEPGQNPPRPVSLVFEAWLTATGKDRRQTVLDGKRHRLIANALKSHSFDAVMAAVVGWRNSPFHRGENDRAKAYNELDLLLRDAAHIEAFRDMALNPNGKQTAATQRVLSEWDRDMRAADELEAIGL